MVQLRDNSRVAATPSILLNVHVVPPSMSHDPLVYSGMIMSTIVCSDVYMVNEDTEGGTAGRIDINGAC